MLSTTEEPSELLTAAAVRDRCGIVFAAAERGETRHFRLVMARLDEAVRRVVEITRRRYPDLDVPYHSRWRHFSAGGVDRAAQVAPGADPDEVARARIDLAVVSVLLDAGAGAALALSRGGDRPDPLTFRGPRGGEPARDASRAFFRRSRRSMAGRCRSAVTDHPQDLAPAFQHASGNELAGIEGRAALLRRRARFALPTLPYSGPRRARGTFTITGRPDAKS